MKKLVALIIAGMMALTMVACGSSDTSSEPTTTAEDSADTATDDASAADDAGTNADTNTTEETPAE